MKADQIGFVKLQIVDCALRIISENPNDASAELSVPVHPLVQAKLDGRIVTGKIEVNAASQIELNCCELPVTRKLSIEVSKDAMTAHVTIDYRTGSKAIVLDESPMRVIDLKIREEPIYPRPFLLSDVQSLLDEQGVVYGIDLESVNAFIQTGEPGSWICAIGRKPIPAVPEHYDVLVTSAGAPSFIGIVPIRPIVTVRENTLLMTHQPDVESIPGVNLFGQVVAAKPVATRLPRLGQGLLEDEEGSVYSTRAGRVIVTPRLLDVANTLVIEHSLSLSDGYIKFDGDVMIQGDVNEGVQITAGGQVFVSGFVSQASITADAGVVISGGVFQSTIRAGTRLGALNDLKQMCISMREEFAQFVQAAIQLQKALGARSQFIEAGKLASILLQEKFVELLRWSKLLLDWKVTFNASIDGLWITWIEHLAYELSQIRLQTVRDIFTWESLLQDLDAKLLDIPDETEMDVDIQVKNAQHADLESTGRMMSVGQGFYQCHLKAGKEISARGIPGVILGCEVMAGVHVVAREIGSQAESVTQIQVQSKEGQIEAGLIYPGTLLTIGHWHHKVVKEMRDAHWP